MAVQAQPHGNWPFGPNHSDFGETATELFIFFHFWVWLETQSCLKQMQPSLILAKTKI